MPTLANRLELLKGRDSASMAAVLADALRHASRDELGLMVTAAIGLGRPNAVAAVVRRLHEVEPAQWDALLAADVDLDGTIRRALDRPTRQIRANVIELIVRRGDPALATHLADLIELAEEGTGERAAAALLELVQATGRGTEPGHHLDAAVAKAARGYERHRREPVLIALALLTEYPGPAVRSLLAERDHPVVHRLRGVGDRINRPVVRRNLLRWFGDERLQHAAGRGLAQLQGDDHYAEVLRDGHLLLVPRRRRALRRVDRPLRCLPPLRVAVKLNPDAQRWLPILAVRLPLSASARRRFLADLVALPSPIARWRAARALIDENRACNQPIFEWLCRDPVGFVAQSAARQVLANGEVDDARLEQLALSHHPAITRRAIRRLASRDAVSLYDRLRLLTPARRLVIAWSLMRRDRDSFVGATRRCMVGDDDRAVDAIGLARRMRIVPEVKGTLIDLSRGERPRVASAAVAALADDRSEASARAIRAALEHPDGRVQANAIESLARLRLDEAVLLEQSNAGHNRLRANAIRGLVRHDRERGVERLNRMLGDANPLHRVSAIWAARSSRARESANHVERLAARDASPEIRTRAAAALRFLKSIDRSAPQEVVH
jgi:HEAT repeat protein